MSVFESVGQLGEVPGPLLARSADGLQRGDHHGGRQGESKLPHLAATHSIRILFEAAQQLWCVRMVQHSIFNLTYWNPELVRCFQMFVLYIAS